MVFGSSLDRFGSRTGASVEMVEKLFAELLDGDAKVRGEVDPEPRGVALLVDG